MRYLAALLSLFLVACSTPQTEQAADPSTPATPAKPSAASLTGEKVQLAIVHKAPVSPEGASILDEAISRKLGQKGLTPADGSAPTKAVEVAVTRYRARHGAARAMLGVMAGSDHIHSTVTIRDVKSGAVEGSFEVRTRHADAVSPVRWMLEKHAEEITERLATGRR